MTKHRVLIAPAHYILDEIGSGSEYFWAAKIIFDLAKSFPKVEFIAICGFANFESKLPNNLKIVEVFKDRKMDYGFIKRLGFLIKYFSLARNILKTKKVDLIHHMMPMAYQVTFNPLAVFDYTEGKSFIVGPCQSPHTFIGRDEGAMAARKKGAPTSSINFFVNKYLLILSSKLLKFIFRRTVNKADKIVVINNYTKNLYQKYIPTEKIVVIPPGINPRKFIFKKKKEKKSFEILTVGYLLERKQIDLLIRVVADLAKKFPNLYLRIIGDGPQRRNLENLARSLGVINKVLFEGLIPHKKIAKFYSQADVFVSTSRSETFGQVLLEAMASGLPVVSSRNIGANEIIEDRKTGFLFNQKNLEELKKVLLKLINNKNLRLKTSQNARKVIKEKYDWKVIAQKYYNLYAQALKR